ncbi:MULTISPECIES: hypothetical protein [Marinicauda]|uniref:hypothetical protein n=1 Tax=Marinicauda TaxID=1649466 RepID=UPI0022E75E6A|nr:hypothetical protein [Marinicauda sp. Alg238-R41]
MTAHEFLSRWHEAVLAKDATALSAIIAEGCELRSPVVWTPTQDKDYLIHILQGVIETVDGFAYRNEVIDGQDLILEFTGTVDGKGLVGIDKITLNEQGEMVLIEVLIRPLNTLMAFAERMRAHALRYQPPAGATA